MKSALLKYGVRWLSGAILALTIGLATQAIAQQEPASGPLDGLVFVGELGVTGKVKVADELHFRDGKFWSLSCIKCGFQPDVYWTRNVGSAIQFRGELNAESGTLLYEGEIIGDRVEVSVRWTKSRWYWKIDRDLEFIGTLAPPEAGLSLTQAVATAASADADMDICSR